MQPHSQDLRERFLDSRDFARISRAIRFIDENFRTQPRLKTIAAEARLSEFHFNRLFRRWAGVTPRQYLAFVTARAARTALHGTDSVLEAAYAVGLSGPGRLHDLMVTLEAVTPWEAKSEGAGLALGCGFADTPFGRALLARSARGLAHLSFVDPGGERAALAQLGARWPRAGLLLADAAAAELVAQIWQPSGRQPVPLPLAVQGTNFQLKVWQALLELGSAGPITYAELALAAGAPGAARAVGNAVGANPVAWIIPCHNVLRQNGDLGGYRWGPDRKRAMLAWNSLGRDTAGVRQLAAAARPRLRAT
jgi:AraC family transcriptional regulator, regulatory protein of adaptative response / methylated-DNA-[protein]-cysteine methyltransferase